MVLPIFIGLMVIVGIYSARKYPGGRLMQHALPMHELVGDRATEPFKCTFTMSRPDRLHFTGWIYDCIVSDDQIAVGFRGKGYVLPREDAVVTWEKDFGTTWLRVSTIPAEVRFHFRHRDAATAALVRLGWLPAHPNA